LEKIRKTLLCGYQKGAFKASSHDLYIYKPQGKGKNSPKSFGGRLQSAVRSQLADVTPSCRELTAEQTPSRSPAPGELGHGRGAELARTAARRKVRPAGWSFSDKANQRLGEVRRSYLC